jgi:hypothetical protein
VFGHALAVLNVLRGIQLYLIGPGHYFITKFTPNDIKVVAAVDPAAASP